MIVYGRQPVREVLRGRRTVERVWATEGAARADWLGGALVERASGERIETLAGTPDHQGICAEAEPYPYARADELLGPPDALVVAMDEVQDPRNLGAVCRVAECAGAAGVVIPQRRAAEVTPVVCRVSAGAVEHLLVARVRNLADWLGEAKEAGAWVYGAALEGAVPYERPDYRGRVVLVLGSEGRGLRPRVGRACDQLVALPVSGRVASLNVSTAAAALLYGIRHFRANPP
jgi:23S rRNA (guanosine2251-2'-O)-methyltransferase